jgi:hypothetical protein
MLTESDTASMQSRVSIQLVAIEKCGGAGVGCIRHHGARPGGADRFTSWPEVLGEKAPQRIYTKNLDATSRNNCWE